MIVQTMRPEEVVRQACLDLPAMWNKMQEPIKKLTHLARVSASARGKEFLKQYRSKAGNNWFVVIRPNTKVIQIAAFVWYRGTDGMYRAARILHDGVSIHISHHALHQYFERFNKEYDGFQRLKEFVVDNMDMALVSNHADPTELRCGIRHGLLTGVMLVPDRVAQLTTFVNHGQLFQDQLPLSDQLDAIRAEQTRQRRRPTPGEKKPWEE